MRSETVLHGANIDLATCTNARWHAYFRQYVADPMMDAAPFVYEFDRVERAFNERTADPTRRYFAILRDGAVIGQIYLKHLDFDNRTSDFGIALTDDAVKGRGYGAEAIALLKRYVFDTLNLKTLFADTVLRNTRSQHVLERAGFVPTHADADFRYYRLERDVKD